MHAIKYNKQFISKKGKIAKKPVDSIQGEIERQLSEKDSYSLKFTDCTDEYKNNFKIMQIPKSAKKENDNEMMNIQLAKSARGMRSTRGGMDSSSKDLLDLYEVG